MKKLLFTALAVLTISFVNAQDTKFGVKIGLNVSSTNQYIPENVSQSSLIGANVGFFADIQISKKFSLQPEMLLSMQGTEVSATAGSTKITGTSKINYINIPVMAKVYVASKFNLQAGPQFGFVAGATDKLVSNSPSISGYEKDVASEYNTFDFGFNFGAGYDISKKILVDLRYNLGITDIVKNVPTGSNNAQNRVFSINVGFKF